MKPRNAHYMMAGTLLLGDTILPSGDPATKEFVYRTSERPASLVAMARAILGREGPGFILLMGDTILTIERWSADEHHYRDWYVTALPSLSDYVWTDEEPDPIWTDDGPDPELVEEDEPTQDWDVR